MPWQERGTAIGSPLPNKENAEVGMGRVMCCAGRGIKRGVNEDWV